ncbi:type IV pilin [Halorhabdus rudnickae]|uniref:type IV pilin n=1 Tax=Halorhabdus rudnickae TaxID=1775544 RepID=UPI001083BA9E|nr:type IV pilin [Halorhabdus rudnickae]
MNGSRSRTASDDRGVSELMAVVTLVGLAVLLVLGIGINVFLFAPDNGGEPEAEFTFRHIEQTSALIITHEDGDSIPSTDLYVEGEDASASWTALAGWEEPRPVEPGDVVQAGGSGAYGTRVGPNDRVSVVWRNESVNGSATLAQWNGGTGP